MAVSASFKQKCPSCESMVSIKDGSLIGKKVECSKCKYRFIVENPVDADKAAIEKDKAGKTNGKAKDGNGAKTKDANGNGAAKAPKKRFRDEDLDDEDEKPKGKPSKKPTRGEDDDDDAPKKDKKAGSSKLLIGLILGGVGFVVLGGVAILMFMNSGGSRPALPPPGGAGAVAAIPVQPVAPGPETEQKKDDGVKPLAAPSKYAGPDPALTNLLPNDTEHIFHLFAKDVLAAASPLRDAAFQTAGSLIDADLKKKIGFSPLAVDDLIRAEKFSNPGWSFTVVHLSEPVNEEALTEALGLEKKEPIKGKLYFEATKPNPWFDQLARLSVGVPTGLRLYAGKSSNRPTFVHVHGPQTLLFADATPLQDFLKAGGKFREITPRPVITQPVAPAEPGGNPMIPGGIPGPGGMPPAGGLSSPMGLPAPGVGAPAAPSSERPGPRVIPSGGVVLPGASLSPRDLPQGAERASLTSALPVSEAAHALQGQGSTSILGSSWVGSETLAGFGKLQFDFEAGNRVRMIDAKETLTGRWSQTGQGVRITFLGGISYTGNINGQTMSGNATNGKDSWTWNVNQQAATQAGAQAPPGVAGIPPPGAQPGGPPGIPPPGAQPGIPPPGAQPGIPPPGAQPGGPPGASPLAPPGFTAPPGLAPGGIQAETPVPSLMAGSNPRDEMYLTIKPSLKAILDKVEKQADSAGDTVLFSAATDMEAARINTTAPEFKERVLRQPRQFWDVTYLLDETTPRIKLLGMALIQKEKWTFQYRNELTCAQEVDAKEHARALRERGAAQVARLFKKLIDHKVDLKTDEPPPAAPAANPGQPGFPPAPGGFPTPPAPGGFPMPPAPGGFPMPPAPGGFPMPPAPGGFPMPPAPGGFPMPPAPGAQPGNPAPADPSVADEPDSSQISVKQKDKTVEFKLDLILDQASFFKLHNITSLLAMAVRSEMDLASGFYNRHDLAKAGKELAEKGLSDRQIGPGQLPPGAFPRVGAKTKPELEPRNRLSWMVGLLPQLGQEPLYHKINFEASWRDPSNWIAGRAVIPQLLDPSYPDFSRQVTPEGLPVDFAATHVVGIAGVGLDAADFPRDDPAFVAKRGVFGYDGSASIAEIQKGRGLSNVAAMIQVPHDGVSGVTPWIAGGGATVRGVPEKNSIAPFVLSNDRTGKPIQYKGKRGTFVLMADGSVRFVAQTITDEAFQAMCTIAGPAPDGFSVDKSDLTPKIPEPKRETDAPAEDDRPPEKSPPKIEAPPAKEEKAVAVKVPANWVTFKSPGGKYSVSMPGQPQEVTQKLPPPLTGEIKMFLALDLAKKIPFVTMAIPIPESDAAKFNTPEGSREFAMGIAASSGGKVLSEKEVTHFGKKGKELVVNATQGGLQITSHIRVFVVNNEVILLTCPVPGSGATPAPEIRAFFDSLKFGD